MIEPDLPSLALSIRQPWAWAVIHAGKDVENRSTFAIGHMRPLVGRRAIHASKGMTQDEYIEGRNFMSTLGIECPPPAELKRGGIIGSVDVTGSTKDSTSRWFFGPRALILANAKPCDFIPAIGALGYFNWKPAVASIIPPAARWMLPANARPAKHDDRMPDLFGGTL